MQIGAELAEFLASPVMIIIGTSDGNGQAEIGRGVGARVDTDAGMVDIIFSGWQWPATADNLKSTGRIAVTFSRPADYVSYQLKGVATLHTAASQDIALAETYMAEITAVLVDLGVDRQLVTPWITRRDAQLARIEVESIFVQTPGSGAGQRFAQNP